ncbi:MAG: tyrosine-type recombinase/integrase [Chloroflexi bacterium]|nr:tyrosine-type recombinase/integrase [Chloroflexota bacterium]
MARGSVEQRSPGTWSIRVELLPDPQTGKRRQKRTTFKGAKREAEKRLSQILHEVDTGSFVNPAKLTVGDFLRQWLKDYVETGVRATTKEGYQIIIEKHLIPNLGNIPLSQLQPAHLQAYYSKALNEGRSDGKGGLSARTVKHHHRVLSEALGHAVRWGLAGRNVALAVDPPRTEGKEMQVLDGAGITRLLEAAQGTVYYPAIHLAVFTGMRRSEILGLRWRDLDLDGSALAVNQVLHVLHGGSVIFQKPKTAPTAP